MQQFGIDPQQNEESQEGKPQKGEQNEEETDAETEE